jgi:hypothetical protein
VSGSSATPLDPATRIGPLIEEAHMYKVLDYIESGKQEGATLVLGGERVLRETGGYFVAATIFDDVQPDVRIARDEILAWFNFAHPKVTLPRRRLRWHGQTRLPVRVGLTQPNRDSTVKRVWRCHPPKVLPNFEPGQKKRIFSCTFHEYVSILSHSCCDGP